MIKLFTHTDLDGVGCAIVLQYKEKLNSLDIEYCNYDEINQKVNEFLDSGIDFNKCYITDISVDDDTAARINQSYADKVELYDHHSTALGLNKYNWCHVGINNADGIQTSGTELFFSALFCNTDVPVSLVNFVELVRDYDTWRWATRGNDGIICKQVNELLYLYGRDQFERWCLTQIYDEVFPRLYAADVLVLDIKQKEINAYVEKKDTEMITQAICGKTAGIVFADRFVSELGNRLCQMHPEIDFVAMINMANGVVSYRTTKDNIDLGKDIAAKFGGGGHQKAAGSRFSTEVLLHTIGDIFRGE